MILEGDNAVLKNRELMGATDPKNAKEGTIRKLYGVSIDKNSVHGSDSVENAKIEINFFLNNNSFCKFNNSFRKCIILKILCFFFKR